MLSPPLSLSPGVTPTAMTVPQQMPSLPLASFYDAKGLIVWPADSPVAGDLKEKRSVFDQASQLALAETKKSGVASIATVTDARRNCSSMDGQPCSMFGPRKVRESPMGSTSFCSLCTNHWPKPLIQWPPPVTGAPPAPRAS